MAEPATVSEPICETGAASASEPAITRVVVVTKVHVDLGFTESAAKVVHDYTWWHLPVAAGHARRLREEGGPRFVYTVPAWLAWTALERRQGAERALIEQALAEGDIAWLASPFTPHSEFLDEQLFAAGLDFSRRLDRRFGRRTTAAKFTDVPGHTRGIIPILAEAGVRLLHVGVNGMSTPPQVPPLFRWRDRETGQEVVVALGSGYGFEARLPGSALHCAFRMEGDNMEVPSLNDIRAWQRELVAAHPQAEVAWGRLDEWADEAWRVRERLPVVEQEIGDSWIHGVGSDPVKVARHRELARLRRSWIGAGRLDASSQEGRRFDEQLVLVGEHTWGAGIQTHLDHDNHNLANADFARVRSLATYRSLEASWLEQRDYLRHAVEALPAALAAEAGGRLAALAPARADLTAWDELTDCRPLELPWGEVAIDAGSASLRTLTVGGRVLADAGHRLGEVAYQSFSADETERYHRQYWAPWVLSAYPEEFLPQALRRHAHASWTRLAVASLHRRSGPEAIEVLAIGAFDTLLHERCGAPGRVEVRWRIERARPRLSLEVQWFDKTATRLPEALWCSFVPNVGGDGAWRLRKCGRWIDPRDVVPCGGRALHAVQDDCRLEDGSGSLLIRTLDAPVVSPGRPQLHEFANQLPAAAGGIHVNLVNNAWVTNFPAWCGEDCRFRFELEVGARQDWSQGGP